MSQHFRVHPDASPLRRRLVAGVALAGLAGIAALASRKSATAAEPTGVAILGGPAEYAHELRIASERGLPLLLFFSLVGCVFCESLRTDQLRHAHRDRERLGIRLVELRIDDGRPLPGTEPQRSPRQLASALRVRLAPTVLFLDGEREVAERLVGYPSPDFYGAYLEARIAQARASTQRESTGRQGPPP